MLRILSFFMKIKDFRVSGLYVFITLLLLTPPLFAENIQKTEKPLLGKISFPTSATPQAEAYFVNGVLFLHSFDYDRARAFFKQAEAADPSFALAYWGEAMSYDHPVWNEQELEAAQAVLATLASTDVQRVAKAKTPREKGFIKALNLLFGKGTKTERNFAYANAMGELYRQYPNDDEIAAFYALALLGKTEGVQDFKMQMQAAAIAEEIYQRNPKHPGALHYMIHAYDDPIHAPLGLRAADIYAEVAPDASHALHMPSHIYLALGLWDGVIHSNQAAWAAGVKHNPQNLSKNYTIHDLHALDWLAYGYLQKKQYPAAYQAVKTMQKIAEESQTPMAKFHYALMRAAYIIASNDWDSDLKPLNMQGMEPASRASDIYTNALIALHKGKHNSDLSADMAELDKLGEMRPDDVSTLKHPDNFTLVTATNIAIAKITALELHAQMQVQQGKFKEAISLLQKALSLEDQLKIVYSPPVPVKPVHELLAEVLLLDQQYVKAYQEYINELKLQPNRALSNQGLALATEKIKERGLALPQGISSYFNKLMDESKG